MNVLINLADRAILPDAVIRMGIRYLDRKRLAGENGEGGGSQPKVKARFVKKLIDSPIAIHTDKANEQHYELPAAFFERVLGKHLKYSGSFWGDGCTSLDDAEAAMLEKYAERAQLASGQRVLELGCGWGSLSLWMAAKFPASEFTAVSNSHSQRALIMERCRQRGITNLTVLTADMNAFDIDQRFDRVVSIEMFEHMRNWQQLLKNVSRWLKADGKLFLHVFSHKRSAYSFEADGHKNNWMGRHFFSGGIMPSHDLINYFDADLVVEADWEINGIHYRKTAEAWRQNLETQREEIRPILAAVYGADRADIWYQRWRIFFMACAELWGYRNGGEWQISHYRLVQKPVQDLLEKAT